MNNYYCINKKYPPPLLPTHVTYLTTQYIAGNLFSNIACLQINCNQSSLNQLVSSLQFNRHSGIDLFLWLEKHIVLQKNAL